MAKQIPIQYLYYVCVYVCFSFHFVFLFCCHYRCHHHHCYHCRCYCSCNTSEKESAKGKMQKANNCIQFIVVVVAIAFQYRCTTVFAHTMYICKLHVIVLFLCFHCKAHSLFYNCHFFLSWLDFHIYVHATLLSMARAITYSAYVFGFCFFDGTSCDSNRNNIFAIEFFFAISSSFFSYIIFIFPCPKMYNHLTLYDLNLHPK